MFNRKAGPLGKKTARAHGSMVGDRVCPVIRSWGDPGEVTVVGLIFIREGAGREMGPAAPAWLRVSSG